MKKAATGTAKPVKTVATTSCGLQETELCNGCKYLSFALCACTRNRKRKSIFYNPKELRPLNSFTNGKGFIEVIKPTDCPVGRNIKKGMKK